MYSFKQISLCVAFFISISKTSPPDGFKIVETTNGPVRGLRRTTLLKNDAFYSFKGIPYAEPPIGELRFKAPEPKRSWTPTILDAFEHSKICSQCRGSVTGPFPQSENCLTLNVYVPANIEPNEKLAVLFFTHGGAYFHGSGNDYMYGPDFLIEKRTILVTFNYRLGVLGFLSLQLPEYSGNMALKDVQLALKWTNQNIERFGGDIKRITIFGHSAGAALTHYQVLSAESRKYFRNAIIMSGSVENRWALSDDDHLKRAFNISNELGESITTLDDLVTFLKSVPAEKLSPFAVVDQINNFLYKIAIAPVVERRDAKQPFLVETPQKIFDTEKINVDTMFTMTSIEMLSLNAIPSSSVLKEYNANFDTAIPFKEFNLPKCSKIVKAIRTFYFGDSPINESTLINFYEYSSDLNFLIGIDRIVKQNVAHSKAHTYYAWFSIDSALNLMKNIFQRDTILHAPGTAHGDELCYLFRCGVAEKLYNKIMANKTDEHSIISHQAIEYIATLFTNFAKYGEPSHENTSVKSFPPVQQNGVHFLHIGNAGLKMDLQPRKEAIKFWTNLKQLKC